MADTVVEQQEIELQELDSVAIRFAGDSGDGMQLTGTQFTNASAMFGNDVSTLPDYPAEIRAPAGTQAGVSGFQVNFASHDIYTPGDSPQVLVAMNPAALKANIEDLEKGGIIIANQDAFTPANLKRAGYDSNPLEDGSLKGYRVIAIPLSTMNRAALEDMEELSSQEKDRCRNFFALGLTYWMYDRPLEPSLVWLKEKFVRRPAIGEANARALRAGYHYGDTLEEFQVRFRVPKAPALPGTYRKVTGNEAAALGLITAAHLADRPLFYGSYPITPASDILHELAAQKNFEVRTFQAEDEIAAMGAAIGAAFGGAFACTATSGPGLCLKSEAINLAIILELPMVIIDVQRGGPSTGLPTKAEQSDLLQAMFGRNGESPIPVLAAKSPTDCFDLSVEAFRIAVRSMTPVILLTDGYLANSSEPWRIPQVENLAPIEVHFATDPATFHPYSRDVELARPWAVPGTPGLEHRIGGLEKQDTTGNVSYDPHDHEHMVHRRAEKVACIADHIPDQEVYGDESGDLLVIGWGSTYGAIRSAVQRARREGRAVAHAHLRYINPHPKNLGDIISRYDRVLVPELNMGQLALLLRSWFSAEVISQPKVQGQPYKISEVYEKIIELVG